MHLSQTSNSCGVTVREMASIYPIYTKLCIVKWVFAHEMEAARLRWGHSNRDFPSGIIWPEVPVCQSAEDSGWFNDPATTIVCDSVLQCNIVSEPDSISRGTYHFLLRPSCCHLSHYVAIEAV